MNEKEYTIDERTDAQQLGSQKFRFYKRIGKGNFGGVWVGYRSALNAAGGLLHTNSVLNSSIRSQDTPLVQKEKKRGFRLSKLFRKDSLFSKKKEEGGANKPEEQKLNTQQEDFDLKKYVAIKRVKKVNYLYCVVAKINIKLPS